MTAIEEIFRSEWGRLLAALIHLLGDFDIAEEALQEAFAIAVTEWGDEMPRNPRAWLFGTARHKAIDRLRRRARFADKQAEIAYLTPTEASIEQLQALVGRRVRAVVREATPSLPGN